MTQHATARTHSHQATEPSKKRDLYDWLDMIIKAGGIVFAVIAALHASAAFEKDFDLKVVEQKLKFANDVLLAAGQIHISQDWKSYEKAEDTFGIMKHGPGIALFGNDVVYKAMEEYYNFCENLRARSGDEYDYTTIYNTVEPEFEKLAHVFHGEVSRI